MCMPYKGAVIIFKCIVSENNVLKAQLEDSKAEIGLQSLQVMFEYNILHYKVIIIIIILS